MESFLNSVEKFVSDASVKIQRMINSNENISRKPKNSGPKIDEELLSNHLMINEKFVQSGHLETSTKFWQFKIDGETTYIRYGNINIDGSLKERAIQVEQHNDEAAAQKKIEALIVKKLDSGYQGW
ncbi:1966_t:CDS:1, partial [Acaulospora morrowiae]